MLGWRYSLEWLWYASQYGVIDWLLDSVTPSCESSQHMVISFKAPSRSLSSGKPAPSWTSAPRSRSMRAQHAAFALSANEMMNVRVSSGGDSSERIVQGLAPNQFIHKILLNPDCYEPDGIPKTVDAGMADELTSAQEAAALLKEAKSAGILKTTDDRIQSFLEIMPKVHVHVYTAQTPFALCVCTAPAHASHAGSSAYAVRIAS